MTFTPLSKAKILIRDQRLIVTSGIAPHHILRARRHGTWCRRDAGRWRRRQGGAILRSRALSPRFPHAHGAGFACVRVKSRKGQTGRRHAETRCKITRDDAARFYQKLTESAAAELRPARHECVTGTTLNSLDQSIITGRARRWKNRSANSPRNSVWPRMLKSCRVKHIFRDGVGDDPTRFPPRYAFDGALDR